MIGQAGPAADFSDFLPTNGTQLQLASRANANAASSAAAPQDRDNCKIELNLEAVMGSVAERLLARRLAAAEPDLT